MKSRLAKKEEGLAFKEILDLEFSHPIGVGSGFDKKASKYNSLWTRSFAFVEVGPFNSLDTSAKSAITRIGKIAPVPYLFCEIEHLPSCVDEESIVADYVSVFSLMYDFVNAITINASRKNTGGSRPLQDITLLSSVLDKILDTRIYYDNYKPIIVKVSPDIHQAQLSDIINYCRLSGIDAISIDAGPEAAETIKSISNSTDGRFPIIGNSASGEPLDIKSLLESGACLVSTKINFKHHGPLYLSKILKSL